MEADYEALQATDKGYFMAQYCTSLTAVTNIMFNDAMQKLGIDTGEEASEILVDKFPNPNGDGMVVTALDKYEQKLFSVQQLPSKLAVKTVIYE